MRARSGRDREASPHYATVGVVLRAGGDFLRSHSGTPLAPSDSASRSRRRTRAEVSGRRVRPGIYITSRHFASAARRSSRGTLRARTLALANRPPSLRQTRSILQWHRQLIAPNWTYPRRHTRPSGVLREIRRPRWTRRHRTWIAEARARGLSGYEPPTGGRARWWLAARTFEHVEREPSQSRGAGGFSPVVVPIVPVLPAYGMIGLITPMTLPSVSWMRA